ncbi:hypothetical protein HKCCE2091_11050 [Rhodobacterales bacterium HKCCE2091]|nr:hypothetical protein [Rhodobacterales bacterium HKCCE2091]
MAFVQSGCGVGLASAATDGTAVVGVGLGCRVRPGGVFRILVVRAPNSAFLDAVRRGAPVAVTFTATRNHESYQVKADRAELCDAASDDQPEIDRQQLLFRDGMVEIGYSPAQAEGYAPCDPNDLVAVEFVPARVFTQTPGPGAGAEVTR